MKATTQLAKTTEKAAVIRISTMEMVLADMVAQDVFNNRSDLDYISIQDGFGAIKNFRR